MDWSHGTKKGEEKLAKRADAQKVEGYGGEEDRNCAGVWVKSDLESVGEEWKKVIDRRNWRLLTENVVREK